MELKIWLWIAVAVPLVIQGCFSVGNHSVHEAPLDNAHRAIERLEKWATWLSGLQTAAMAALGVVAKGLQLSEFEKTLGFFAFIFFGSSIFVCTLVLGALPTIQLRLTDPPSSKNDIYHEYGVGGLPVPIWFLAGLQHMYFFLGMGCFAIFLFKSFDLQPKLLP
jgi:hypothetical protein